MLRRFFGWSALIVIPAVAALLGFEWYTRQQIVEHYEEDALIIITNQGLTPVGGVDEFFGRNTVVLPNGLFKTNETFLTAFVKGGEVVLETAARSNGFGLLSDREYVAERNPQSPEYRVVVLGDSMTGTTVGTRQWVDYLEDLLNAEGRHLVDGKTFRTYNLGWNGAGFPHFHAAFNRAGRQFDPDLVVVNYIESDFPRTDRPDRPKHLTDREEMVDQARDVMEAFLSEHDDVLFTVMPLSYELTGEPDYARTKAVQRDLSKSGRLTIMRAAMLEAAGANEREIDNEEIVSWYNLPYDGHMSDQGGEIYARALAAHILQHISDTEGTAEFERFSILQRLRSVAPPRGFDLRNGGLHILSNAEHLTNLRREIATETLKGRLDKWRFYTLDRILGQSIEVFSPDFAGQAVSGANVQVHYGPGEKDVAFLNIACASEPYELSNPECQHSYFLFAD